MNILVTGGAGYIGSHTCVALLEAGHTVIVADNLCNSKAETIDRIEQITDEKVTFYQIDVTDEKGLDTIFSNHKIDGIIHFAGLKAVGESVEKPLAYYYNNTVSTMILCHVPGNIRVMRNLYPLAHNQIIAPDHVSDHHYFICIALIIKIHRSQHSIRAAAHE
jgi:UDP-glucose 4-epimerase